MKRMFLVSLVWILSITFTSPAAADFSPGNLFIVNTPSSRSAGFDTIDQFTPEGIYVDTLIGPEQEIKGIRDLVYDSATDHLLYSVNNWTPMVFEIREIDASGSLIQTYTHDDFGSGNIEMVFGPDHTLYIANSGHVYRRGPGETQLTQFCDLPINPATSHPIGIGDLEIDSQGNLYLSDFAINYNVYRIYPDGSVEIFADQEDGLYEPYGIAMDDQDNLYACNSHGSNHAIVKISPEGEGEIFVSHGQLSATAHDLAFDDQGFLLAACRNAHDVFRIDPEGNIVDAEGNIDPDGNPFLDEADGLSDPASIVQIPFPCQVDVDGDTDVDGSDLFLFMGSYDPACLNNFSTAFGQVSE